MLPKVCLARLHVVQEKVEVLIKKEGGAVTEALDDPEEDADEEGSLF